MRYESYNTVESRACPGVRFRVRRMSLARRIDLVRLIRQTGEKLAFHAAGESVEDATQAAEIRARMDALYIEWGLDSIEGMTIDGAPIALGNLLERGPDELAQEIAEAVRRELFLDENQRKN